MSKSTSTFTLLLVAAFTFTGCSGKVGGGAPPIEKLYWKDYGYQAFPSPRDYMLPGAIIDSQGQIEGADKLCFAQVPRYTGNEQFWTVDREITSDFGAELSAYLPIGKDPDSLSADFARNEVSTLKIVAPEPGPVMYLEKARARTTAEDPSISRECASALQHGAYLITQVVAAPRMEFHFKTRGDRKLNASIIGLAKAHSNLEWKDDYTLVLKDQLYVGYKSSPIVKGLDGKPIVAWGIEGSLEAIQVHMPNMPRRDVRG